MVNRRIRVAFLFLFVGFLFSQFSWAQDADSLKQNIAKAVSGEEAGPQLEKLSDICSSNGEFDDFLDFLEGLEKDRKFSSTPLLFYYKALARYKQMQYLEENQMWEQLFDNKDLYRQQLEKDLEQAQKLSVSVDEFSLKLKLLEWQLIREDSAASLNTLEELFNLAQSFLESGGDTEAVKDIADKLAASKEDNYAKKLYSIYVSQISDSDISRKELKDLADSFLKDGRIDFATSLYDAFIEKAINFQEDKSLVIADMFAVAEKFANSGWQEGLDSFYAEEVYKKIESLYGREAFSDTPQYKRAYNLERSKEYESSVAEYLKLVDGFPKYPDRDRIYFRLGIISAYISKQVDKAKEYFLKVVNGYPQSPDRLNSLYHLGLLSQWQGDKEGAMKYYLDIQKVTKDAVVKPELASLTESRIKEIVEGKEIDYNLRTFLETKLNDDQDKGFIQLDLYAKSAKENSGQPIVFQTTSYLINTGCLQQEFTYLWSGQLGDNQTPFNESEFPTSYGEAGTKVVNVVLVGPTGAVDGTVEMADIYI